MVQEIAAAIEGSHISLPLPTVFPLTELLMAWAKVHFPIAGELPSFSFWILLSRIRGKNFTFFTYYAVFWYVFGLSRKISWFPWLLDGLLIFYSGKILILGWVEDLLCSWIALYKVAWLYHMIVCSVTVSRGFIDVSFLCHRGTWLNGPTFIC